MFFGIFLTNFTASFVECAFLWHWLIFNIVIIFSLLHAMPMLFTLWCINLDFTKQIKWWKHWKVTSKYNSGNYKYWNLSTILDVHLNGLRFIKKYLDSIFHNFVWINNLLMNIFLEILTTYLQISCVHTDNLLMDIIS